MDEIERARAYAGIFLSAGERWRSCVPVDGLVEGDTVRIGDVTLAYRRDDTWTLSAPGRQTVRLRKAAA